MEDVAKIRPNTATLTRTVTSGRAPDAYQRRLASCSSIVGSDARSRSTARANSSESGVTTFSFFLRRARSRSRRASCRGGSRRRDHSVHPHEHGRGTSRTMAKRLTAEG